MSPSPSPANLHAPNVAGLLPEAAVTALIDHAVKMPASDLFFSINDKHVGVSVRHLGIVRLLTILTPEQGQRCTSYIKAMAGMDLAEQRRPLDGRWVRGEDSVGAGRVDLRVSTIPTLHGEDLSIRLLSCNSQMMVIENFEDARKPNREEMSTRIRERGEELRPVPERSTDGKRRALAEPADRRRLHRLEPLVDLPARHLRLAVGEPLDDVRERAVPDPARGALLA